MTGCAEMLLELTIPATSLSRAVTRHVW